MTDARRALQAAAEQAVREAREGLQRAAHRWVESLGSPLQEDAQRQLEEGAVAFARAREGVQAARKADRELRIPWGPAKGRHPRDADSVDLHHLVLELGGALRRKPHGPYAASNQALLEACVAELGRRRPG